LIPSAFSAEIAMHMDYNKTIILIQSDGMKGNYNCYRLLTRVLMMCVHYSHVDIVIRTMNFLGSDHSYVRLALPRRAGSPQQHMPITVGPFT
jgi:hypothetical protein